MNETLNDAVGNDQNENSDIIRYPYVVRLQVQLGQVVTVVDVPVLAQNEAEAIVLSSTNVDAFIKKVPLMAVRTAQ